MQIIKSFFKLLLFVCPVFATAQSTYIETGSKDNHFVDRLEIKQQKNTHLNFSTLKPYTRRAIVRQAEFIDSARLGYTDSLTGQDKYKEWYDQGLSVVDEYNLHSFLMNNSEWVSGPREDFKSKRPILRTFYKTKTNFFEVKSRDFFLALNPVLQFTAGVETGTTNQSLYINSRGLSLRGMIARKVGFASTIIENQERCPQF